MVQPLKRYVLSSIIVRSAIHSQNGSFSEQAVRFKLQSDCDSNKMISNPLLPLQVLVPPSESTVTTAEKYEVPSLRFFVTAPGIQVVGVFRFWLALARGDKTGQCMAKWCCDSNKVSSNPLLSLQVLIPRVNRWQTRLLQWNHITLLLHGSLLR